MMYSPTELYQELTKTNKIKFIVAYSGGMDSHVLLHSLAFLRDIQGAANLQQSVSMKDNMVIQVKAIHVHHGLSVNADKWVRHCQQVCAHLNIDLIIKYVDAAKKTKHSPEAIARELRYQEFAKLLHEDECLVTAHHANDQAETVLLQLFRGSGTKGLSAIPKHRGLAKGCLLRPLLAFSREELLVYAKKHSLQWIEDESNENIGFDRNFIRHQLLPLVKQRWPGILTTLSRTAIHCSQTSDLLNILAEQDYLITQGNVPNTLSIKKLLALNIQQQNNLLRFWLKKLDLTLPSSVKLQHIITDVINCRADALPVVHWEGTEVRRYRDDLYAMSPLPEIDTGAVFLWDVSETIVLPYIGTVDLTRVTKLANFGTNNDVTIRFYNQNKIKIKNRQGTRDVGKLFQEWDIPPWLRKLTPLICEKEELIGFVRLGTGILHKTKAE